MRASLSSLHTVELYTQCSFLRLSHRPRKNANQRVTVRVRVCVCRVRLRRHFHDSIILAMRNAANHQTMLMPYNTSSAAPCLCCKIKCSCTTASLLNHLVSMRLTTTRLEATRERQKHQLQLELLGTRLQHIAPLPPGSLPALRDKRYQKMAKYSDRRDLTMAFRIWAAVMAARKAKYIVRQRYLDAKAAEEQAKVDAVKAEYLCEEERKAAEAAERARVEAQERLVRRKHAARVAVVEVIDGIIEVATNTAYALEMARDAKYRAEEAIRANADIGTGRGKWAQAHEFMVMSYLNVFGSGWEAAVDGWPHCSGWEMAQKMSAINKAWKFATTAWSRETVTMLRLHATPQWPGRIMRAIQRTAPGLEIFELQGFDRATCVGLELVSSSLSSLTFRACSDVGALLETVADHLGSLKHLAVHDSRLGEGNGFAAIAESSCAQLAILELGGHWVWPESSSLFRESEPLPPPKEENGAIDGAVLQYARALALGEEGLAKPLQTFRCTNRLKDEAVRALCRSSPLLTDVELHDVASVSAVKDPLTLCVSLRVLKVHTSMSIHAPPWSKLNVEASVAKCPTLRHLRIESLSDGSLVECIPWRPA